MIVTDRDITAGGAVFFAALDAVFPAVGPATVFDVGASDCTSSLAVAARYPLARVFALECDEARIVAALRKLAENRPGPGERVTLIPAAAARASENRTFYPVRENAEAGSLFAPSGEYDYRERYTVRVPGGCEVLALRIADVARREGVEAIDAAWMDCQGSELEALEGMGELAGEALRVVQLETCYRGMYAGAPLWPELDAWLQARGFACVVRSEMLDGHWGDALYVRAPWAAIVEPAVAAVLERCPRRP